MWRKEEKHFSLSTTAASARCCGEQTRREDKGLGSRSEELRGFCRILGKVRLEQYSIEILKRIINTVLYTFLNENGKGVSLDFCFSVIAEGVSGVFTLIK